MPRLAPVNKRVRRGWLDKFGINLSRVHAHFGPCLAQARTSELDAIVEAEGPVVPELHRDRHDAIAGPVRRARHGADCVFGRVDRYRLLEGEPAFQWTRLLTRPGADLRALRARREVGVGFLGRHALDGAADPDLPVQRFPVEEKRGFGIRGKLAAL